MKRALRYDLVADNVGDLFDYRAARSSDKVFARFEDTALTYGDLDRMSNRIRSALRREGIGKGQRVAAFLYNSPWHLALLLACARDGVVWCPINVALRRTDLSYTVNDLDASAILVDQELLDVYGGAELARRPQTVVVGCSGTPALGVRLEDWLGDGEVAKAASLQAGDPLCIIYSGGTTGLPKGVIMPHGWPISAALRLSEVATFREREVFFTALQLYHGWAACAVLPFCLYFDHEFCFWKWWSASRFVDYVRKYNATIVDPFVGMIATLLRQPERPEDRALPARIAISAYGGYDPVSMDLRQQFEQRFRIDTYQAYGLTEAGAFVTVQLEGEPRKPGSAGKLRGWYDVSIVDDDGLELPIGQTGEIWIRPRVPHMIALGYHNKWAETVRTWQDLWIHTGDLGFFDDDGDMYFVGRKGHFLRRRGELVAVAEIEAVIRQLPGIVDVAVVGVPSELGEDDIKACIVTDGRPTEPAAVAAFCGERIAYFKVPRYVEFWDELPRSPTKQEVERFRLRERGVAGAWDREAPR